jgi:hypothetical protein
VLVNRHSIKNLKLFKANNFQLCFFSDCFCRSVLSPEEDNSSRSEGRKPFVGQRDEHQNRGLWLQQ